MIIQPLTDEDLAIWEKLSGGVEYEDFVRTVIGKLDCYEVKTNLNDDLGESATHQKNSGFVKFKFGKDENNHQGNGYIYLASENDVRTSEPFNFSFKRNPNHLGSRVMANIIHAVRKTGIEEMIIDAEEVGPFIWNVMGGVPNKSAFYSVCEIIQQRLDDGYAAQLLALERGKDKTAEEAAAAIAVLDMLDKRGDPQQLWAVSALVAKLEPRPTSFEADYAKGPTEIGKLLLFGSKWKGKFDLREGSPSMQKLTAYEILKGFRHER